MSMPMDPMNVPSPVTPADSPSDPAGYASVTPHGQGPAPYNLFDPMANMDLSGAVSAARELAGGQEGTSTGAGASGFGDVTGPRQAATAALLNSPAGFSAGGGTSGYDITPGWSGSSDDPGDGWPNSPQPSILETPIQGAGSNQANTGTD